MPWFFGKVQNTLQACALAKHTHNSTVDFDAIDGVVRQCEQKIGLYQAHNARIACTKPLSHTLT